MTRPSQPTSAVLVWGIVLVALTFAAFRPALHDAWIWDDNDYVTSNPYLGDLAGLETLWLNIHARHQYYPLVYSTYWVEYHLWRLQPTGYHADNIALHAIAALLLWRVLERLRLGAPDTEPSGGRRKRWLPRVGLPGAELPGAPWVAAALFAVHPVCVESVAWVTERKNVLMFACYMLAMWAYVRADEGEFGVRSSEFGVAQTPPHGDGSEGEPITTITSPFVRESATPNSELRTPNPELPFRTGWYFLALLFFVAAMLSKTVAASFPVGVLILIWWKRGTWRVRSIAALVPFFVIGAGLGLVTAHLERTEVGAEGAEFALSFAQRVLVAGRALWFYAAKVVWPSHLCFVYPHWTLDPHQAWQWAYPISALALAAVLLLGCRLWGRGPAAAAAFFAATLAPALGFLNVYPFRFSYVADHFQYVAAVGLIVLGVGAATWLLQRAGRGVAAAGGVILAAAALAACATITYARCPVLANPETLWRDTLATNDAAWIAHNDLGLILSTQGKGDEAIAHFRRVLELKPDHVKARANLGVALDDRGQLAEARAQFQRAVDDEPRYPDAHNGLGHVLFEQGDIDGAINQYRQALKANPHFAEALVNLGIALARQGQTGAAMGQFEAALRERPGYAVADIDLGALLEQRGDERGALAYFQAAVGADPADADAQLHLGIALSRANRVEGALPYLQKAVELRPQNAAAHSALGIALARLHRLDQAIAQFEETLRLNPGDNATRSNLEHARALRAK